MIKNCIICGKEMEVPNWLIKRKKYCSRHCHGIAAGQRQKEKFAKDKKLVHCMECQKEMWLPKHLQGKQKFCSKKCKTEFHKIKDYKRYIQKNIVKDGNCWIWIKAHDPSGYGVASKERKKIHAHRLSYLAFKGEIPKGMCILHSCDVKACCNPDHLWLGTQKDNMQDCIKKGRHTTQIYDSSKFFKGGNYVSSR